MEKRGAPGAVKKTIGDANVGFLIFFDALYCFYHLVHSKKSAH
jgi:hypothetical protein